MIPLYQARVTRNYIISSQFSLFTLFLLAVFSTIFFTPAATAKGTSKHEFFADLNFLANFQDDGDSWLTGNLGRFSSGSEANDVSEAVEANIAYQYRPLSYLSFRAHIQAQESSRQTSAKQIGLIEWGGRLDYDIDFAQEIRVDLGQFFLPISMENINDFWESPYTLSFSSLNSWIGEEFRPIGLDVSYRYHFDRGDQLTFSAMPFWGNDSMGALLAFRGWSYGRQRTAYSDVLRLPNLTSLDMSEPFEGQRNDGTKPFGPDLDGRPGYSLRTSYTSTGFRANISWVDNQGDTTLIKGEYAWRTRFAIAGMSWSVTDNIEILTEAMFGDSTMGVAPGVDIDFYSTYLMASYRINDYRISARYDQFGIDDKDLIDQESNELGRSYTLALMWSPEGQNFRLGTETMYLNSKRSKILASGETHKDAESVNVTMLAKYTF